MCPVGRDCHSNAWYLSQRSVRVTHFDLPRSHDYVHDNTKSLEKKPYAIRKSEWYAKYFHCGSLNTIVIIHMDFCIQQHK